MCLLTAQADDCHVHDKNFNDILHAVRKCCLKEDRLLCTVCLEVVHHYWLAGSAMWNKDYQTKHSLKASNHKKCGVGKVNTGISLIPPDSHMLDWKHCVIK